MTPAVPTSTPAATETGGTSSSTKSEKSASHSTKVECINKAEKRALEIREKAKGCELGYTKGGQESVVARAGHGTGYCEKALTKIEDKLTASGYECK